MVTQLPMSESNVATRLERVKAKRLLYGMLSVLWFFPSIGAVWILCARRDNPRGIPIEHWVALALLAAHLMLIMLALRNHFRLRRLGRVEKQPANGHSGLGTP